MQILFIKLSAIGDVVQTLPALEAVKRRYPDSTITWVVEEAAADILVGHPAVSRLLVSKRKTWLKMLRNPQTTADGLRSIARFFRELRSVQYDIAVDFQGLLKSGVLIGLSRARRKIGFDRTRELSYLFLNERLRPFDIEKHALERYLDVARHLGVEYPSTACKLPVSNEIAVVGKRVGEIRKEGAKLIVINPVARWRTKLWPERNFARLADRIASEKSNLVIFTGSRADREAIGRIIGMMRGKAFNWAGETTLRELAALATLADLFITTDTGPMHLAAAVGVRVIALFGPTAPWRTGPYGPSHVVVRTGIECSPCFNRTCHRNRECMEGISVEDVFSRISV